MSIKSHLELIADGSDASLARVVQLTHSIHGAGASFGFATVGTTAGLIEQRIKQEVSGRTTPHPRFVAELRSLISDLEKAVRCAENTIAPLADSGKAARRRR